MKKQVANNISFSPLEKFIHDNVSIIDGKESLHNSFAYKQISLFLEYMNFQSILVKTAFLRAEEIITR